MRAVQAIHRRSGVKRPSPAPRDTQLLSANSDPWDQDSEPKEVWSALEDLWLRLKDLGVLRVEQGTSSTCVVVLGLRCIDRLEPSLRGALLDVETYQARRGGRLWAFVQTLRFRGADLVCELTPPERIARWSCEIDGVGLSWQVRGLVARLKSAQ